MRLCHVIESAATGSASVMLTLAEFGARQGHDVTVVYSPVRASAQFLARIAAIDDVRFVPMVMHRAPGLHDLAAVARLRRFLRRHRFDVVHSHSSKAGALARIAGIGLGGVQIYSPHGFVTMGAAPKAAFRVAERFLSRICDAIVAVSHKEQAHGHSIGIAEAKITVVPNGVDRSVIAEADRPSVRSDRFTVGFVGRLSAQKQPLLALDAFQRLFAVHPSSRLIVVGDGELREAVAARIATLGIGSSTEMAGEARALDFYDGFDALLCSSRFEGMSLTFLEALARGVPIVSTDVGGVDELIDEGVTGHVCAPMADALAKALIGLAALGDSGRHEMRLRSLDKARAFTTQIMAKRTHHLYERCMRER